MKRALLLVFISFVALLWPLSFKALSNKIWVQAEDYTKFEGSMARGSDVGIKDDEAIGDFILPTKACVPGNNPEWYIQYTVHIPKDGKWFLWGNYKHPDGGGYSFCEVYMAGGYQTTGETAIGGTGFDPDSGGGWVNGRGDETMTMLPVYVHIVDFFTSFDWWQTEPHNELVTPPATCLADPGKLYAIYLPDCKPVTINLEPGTYRARWFNPGRGEWIELPDVTGPQWTSPNPNRLFGKKFLDFSMIFAYNIFVFLVLLY